MQKLFWFASLYLLFFTTSSFAYQVQKLDQKQVRAINNYVDFVNESAHGMLIVNKLLENYNQDINKFVDLESYKVNNYTNSDLPMDVFQDPERLFFNKLTPFELFDKCIKESSGLPAASALALNDHALKIKTQITIINNLRFDLDKATIGVDLSKKENLAKVYALLEKGVSAFDLVYKQSIEIEKIVSKFQGVDKTSQMADLLSIYSLARAMIKKVREKETDGFETLVVQYNSRVKKLGIDSKDPNNIIKQLAKHGEFILQNATQLSESFKRFSNDDVLPESYRNYGRYYYYHNVGMISKFNRYGTGLASEMNEAIDMLKLNIPHVLELPHMYSVLYPKALEDTTLIESKTKNITALPQKLKDRNVVTANENVIWANSQNIELLLYDHMIQDGDIVSINFNGDWILEKAEIERKPQTVKLKLNPNGKNYLVLHAESVGTRPPNTMAVSYVFKGVKRDIILKSDYNTSALIDIKYEK